MNMVGEVVRVQFSGAWMNVGAPRSKHEYHLCHPKYTTSQQPTVTPTTGSNIGTTTTHSYSIHANTHIKHGERVFGLWCVFGGVEGWSNVVETRVI